MTSSEFQAAGRAIFLARAGQDQLLKRIEIVTVTRNKEDKSKIKSIRAFLVDEGQFECLKRPEAWHLPADFVEENFPRQSFEMVMTGMRPQGKQLCYSYAFLPVLPVSMERDRINRQGLRREVSTA